MKAEDILGLLVPVTFVVFLVTERLFPRRSYPPVRFWNLIGFAGLIMTALIATFLPMMLPVAWTQHHLFNLSGLGLVASVVVAYPLTALGSALLHRAFHEFHPLWLLGHQLHHSPQRLDIPGSVFFHPVDIALQTVPATLVSVFVLGLDPIAAGAVGYVSAFYGMFQHWNVRTPPWVGYIIQRPESHGLHHELGIHGRNYSDFPLWDMLMGTFVNPATFDGEVGFAGDAPGRIGAMLLFRDVNERRISLPQFENFRIHAFNVPTRYVGGDFYDFLQLSSEEWMGVLADVSGKGISAALLSSMVLGALNMEFHSGTQPQEVLNRINRLLCEKSLPYQFVTLFLFLLSPQGAGHFISAGHNPAYVFRSATGKIEELASDAYVLGLLDFASYQSRPFRLDKGDILVVYSDGLTDAQNPREEMFGEERLLELIRQAAPLGSDAVERNFLQAIQEFTEGTPQTDDITFVVVEKYQ